MGSVDPGSNRPRGRAHRSEEPGGRGVLAAEQDPHRPATPGDLPRAQGRSPHDADGDKS